MEQKIIKDYPPLFSAIADALPGARSKGVIFSWGDEIYNPSGAEIPPQLLAHEAVHGIRQKAEGVEEWWRRYMTEPSFRLAEELPAHVAEYIAIMQMCSVNRKQRRAYLAQMSKRLAGPLYGRLMTVNRARKLILDSTRFYLGATRGLP